jgi:hypothetical protein
MRFGRFFRSCTLLGLLAASFAVAQEPEPKPAAKDANAVPSTFRSFIVLDKRTDAKDPLNRTNKIHCLVCENNLNPVVAVFSRSQPTKEAGADDPLSKLTVGLAKLLTVDKYKAQNFASFLIFATLDKEFQSDDKRDLYAAAIKTWGEATGVGGVVLGLTGQTSDAVKTWNLEKDNDITVVLYHRMKMVQKPWTFAEGKMTAADVKAILAAAEAELGKK